MKDKLIFVLDQKRVWLGLGAIVGAVFGDQAAGLVGTVGTLVMALI